MKYNIHCAFNECNPIIISQHGTAYETERVKSEELFYWDGLLVFSLH